MVTNGKVAAATQNQALCDILFLYKNVLNREIEWINNTKWTERPKKLPMVFSESEIKKNIILLDRVQWPIANVMDQYGLRLNECVSLEIQDIDFDCRQIKFKNIKGEK